MCASVAVIYVVVTLTPAYLSSARMTTAKENLAKFLFRVRIMSYKNRVEQCV